MYRKIKMEPFEQKSKLFYRISCIFTVFGNKHKRFFCKYFVQFYRILFMKLVQIQAV